MIKTRVIWGFHRKMMYRPVFRSRAAAERFADNRRRLWGNVVKSIRSVS